LRCEAPTKIKKNTPNLPRLSRYIQIKELPMNVDEFVKSKVRPEYREVVELIRRYVRQMAPNAQEYITYGIPVYKVNKIFAVISPTKKDITFSFSRGAEFEDKYALLQGVGKVSKFIKFKSVDEVNEEVLAYYIKQALDLDAK
jgi:hypothetical protein